MQTRYKATTKSFCQQQCCATAVARVVKRKTRFQFVTTNQTKMQYNQQPAGAPGYPQQMPPPSYEQVVHVQAPVRVVHHTTAPPPVVIIQRGFFSQCDRHKINIDNDLQIKLYCRWVRIPPSSPARIAMSRNWPAWSTRPAWKLTAWPPFYASLGKICRFSPAPCYHLI